MTFFSVTVGTVEPGEVAADDGAGASLPMQSAISLGFSASTKHSRTSSIATNARVLICGETRTP